MHQELYFHFASHMKDIQYQQLRSYHFEEFFNKDFDRNSIENACRTLYWDDMKNGPISSKFHVERRRWNKRSWKSARKSKCHIIQYKVIYTLFQVHFMIQTEIWKKFLKNTLICPGPPRTRPWRSSPESGLTPVCGLRTTVNPWNYIIKNCK